MSGINFQNGTLEIIIGNMFSGKSTELIRRINREKSIGKRIVVINYFDDNRYSDDSVATHDNVLIKSYKLKNLYDFPDYLIEQTDSFFIDEGQFFEDLYGFISELVDKHNKHVIVAGLDGDYRRKKFGFMLDLIPICDSVTKLKAYCKGCNNGTYGPFTKKINGDASSLIDIGSDDKYIPVCRTHFLIN
jgi:thymidine kinase